MITIGKASGVLALFLTMFVLTGPADVKRANGAPHPQDEQACEVMGTFAEEFARGRDAGVPAENFRHLTLEDLDETMYRNVMNVIDLIYRNPNVIPAQAKAWITRLCMKKRA